MSLGSLGWPKKKTAWGVTVWVGLLWLAVGCSATTCASQGKSKAEQKEKNTSGHRFAKGNKSPPPAPAVKLAVKNCHTWAFDSPRESIERQYLEDPTMFRWSDDNLFVAVASPQNVIRIIDAQTGDIKRSLRLSIEQRLKRGGARMYRDSFYWHKGQYVITAIFEHYNNDYCMLVTWDIESGKGNVVERDCKSAKFDSNRDNMMWIVPADKNTNEWVAVGPVAASTAAVAFEAKNGSVNSFQWGSEDKYISFVTRSSDQKKSTVEIWRLKDGVRVFHQTLPGKQTLHWSNTGKHILLQTKDGVHIVDTKAWKKGPFLDVGMRIQQQVFERGVRYCEFSPDGGSVVFELEETDAAVYWNFRDDTIGIVRREWMSNVQFSPDSSTIIFTAKLRNKLTEKQFWWRPDLKEPSVLIEEDAEVEALGFVGKNALLRLVILGSDSIGIADWDGHTGKIVKRYTPDDIDIEFPGAWIQSSAFEWASGGNHEMYAANVRISNTNETNRAFEIRNGVTGKRVGRIPIYRSNRVRSMSFSNDGKLAIGKALWTGGGPEGRVELWHVDEPISYRSWFWLEHAVNTVSFSHKEGLLAAGGGTVVRVFDLNLAVQKKVSFHDPWVSKLEWTPDDRRIGSIASYEDVVKYWDRSTGTISRRFYGQTSAKRQMFSPDGKWAVTSTNKSLSDSSKAASSTFYLWPQNRGVEKLRFDWADTPAVVSWSPDSRFLLLLSEHKAAVWCLEENRLCRTAVLPNEMHFAISLGWHPSEPRVLVVDRHMKGYEWSFSNDENHTLKSVSTPRFEQYRWIQNTGEPYVIHPAGTAVAFADDDSIVLRTLPEGKERILIGRSTERSGGRNKTNKDEHMVVDENGRVKGDASLLSDCRKRTSFDLHAPLENISKNDSESISQPESNGF